MIDFLKNKIKKILISVILSVSVLLVIYYNTQCLQVNLLVPANCIDYDITDEFIENYKKLNIVENMYLDEDSGLVYMNLTKKQYEQILKNVENSLKKMLNNLSIRDVSGNILEVIANDDYSRFIVVLSSQEIFESDTEILTTLNYIQLTYSAFFKTDFKNISIDFAGNEPDNIFNSLSPSWITGEDMTDFEKDFMNKYHGFDSESMKDDTDDDVLEPDNEFNSVIQEQIDANGMS